MSIIEKTNLYLDQMETCRNIGNDIDYLKLNNDALIDSIQNNAKNRFEIMISNKKILNEILNLDVDKLSEEDIDNLEKFSNKLFDFSASHDSALFMEINKKLLEYAKFKNIDELVIRYSYNYAIGLYYVNGESNYVSYDYKTKIGDIFKNVVDTYFSNYLNYDEKTRFYLLRCFGNRKMSLDRETLEGCLETIKETYETLDVLNDEKLRKLNPNIPFDKMIYSTHLDLLACAVYLRTKNVSEYNQVDKQIASSLLDSLYYIENKEKEKANDENRVQNWRIEYFSHIIRYHNSMITIYELLNFLMTKVEKADSKDYTPNGIRENVKYCAYLLEYCQFLDESERKSIEERLNKVISKVLFYIENLRDRNYPQLVNNVFTIFTITEALNGTDKNKSILDYIIYSHRPTYVHSLMVAILTKKIVEHMTRKNSSYFIGVLNTKNELDVKNKKEEILNLAFNGALYHDVGKTLVISYVATYERSLFDEEFECVKAHPEFGYKILQAIGKNDLALCARYHHVSFDSLSGYPKNLEVCPKFIKPIVDIISISDSLDAATDFVGRSYKAAKNFDKVLEEFVASSGTKYSPQVVELLKDDDVCKNIKYILEEERKQVYISVYKNKKYEEKNEPSA